MAHDAKNHLSFDGGDADFIWFSVRSRSRGDGDDPLRHTVAICKRTGFISCTCEHATFRKLTDRYDSRAPNICWHSRQILRWAVQMLKRTREDE